MESGSIVEEGNHLALMALKGKYYTMVETSMRKDDISAVIGEEEE